MSRSGLMARKGVTFPAIILDETGDEIAYMVRRYVQKLSDEQILKEAEVIVRAVNMHQELVEALRLTLSALMPYYSDGTPSVIITKVLAVIAKAEGL